jgi:elongation factor P
MKISAVEVKPGMIIEHKNDYWNVLKAQHVKPGQGGAFNQVELKSITKGTKLNERFRSSETIEKAELEERKFNFLYLDENNFHFMDNKTFEQISIPKSLTEEKYKLLKENLEVSITFMDEKPLSVQLPNNVECIVDITDVAIKGQTAASSYKPATLDSGLKINVPPFVESGDKIILDTRTLEYVKKIN